MSSPFFFLEIQVQGFGLWFSLMKVQLLLALHTEDFEMCFQDYMKALEIMEGLVESDHRGIAEMYPYC